MQTPSILIPIDERLRNTLLGIQSIMGVGFDGKEFERIFSEAKEDKVSEKSYELFGAEKKKVMVKVDEYEPETITLSVLSSDIDQKKLEEIYEDANIAVFRKMKQDNESVGQITESSTPHDLSS
ncbi:MAG: hypothetical protein P8L44_14505 [Opitutales bacterium]|nr:hypothetical protein [Opitutales bacterium]